MNVLGYTESGAIRVIFDGDENESTVPDDMGNRHRAMIAEWEAEGNTIPAYEPRKQILKENTQSPVEKLIEFLQANPDVAMLIEEGTMNDKNRGTT